MISLYHAAAAKPPAAWPGPRRDRRKSRGLAEGGPRDARLRGHEDNTADPSNPSVHDGRRPRAQRGGAVASAPAVRTAHGFARAHAGLSHADAQPWPRRGRLAE